MHPQDPQTMGYYQPGTWTAPRQRPSAGHTALLWIILVLLVINLGLTLYVFGVVHQVVQELSHPFGA